MNKIANLRRSNFVSNSSHRLNTSEKQYPGAINCVYYVIGIDFTELCHVSFNRVVESLLCSLHERPVLLCKRYLLEIAALSKVSDTLTLIRVALSVEVQA